MADSINPSGINKNLSINLLPNFYKTDPNKRFLQATVDQLVKPGTVKKVNGYIGRQNAKAVTGSDIFIEASDKSRQDYQLEPSLVINDTLGNNTFFKDYIDYINQLKVFGANVDNHARLNKQEFYSWDPHIDWDKFVNFQNYYWLPFGPDTIRIYGKQRDVVSTYRVKIVSDISNNHYLFTPDGLTPNPVIKLYRGLTYNFEVDSTGNPFAIKTSRTADTLNRYDIGVTNNATQTGTLTFRVPDNAPSLLYYQSESDVNTGGVFEIFDVDENSTINVEDEILGKVNYKLSDGTALSNGMKISFGGDVYPTKYANAEFYVEGIGTAIKLINKTVLEVTSSYTTSELLKFDTVPFDTDAFGDSTGFAKTLDYIVINRASTDHNPWSRYNRWFHKDTIQASAKFNGSELNLDQTLRAVRPIIEFEANLKLFNFGINAVEDIDLVDTFTTDAFSIVEGSLGYNVDSINLSEGQKILFLADTDRLVKNNLYQVEFIDVKHTVVSGISSRQIRLVKIAEPTLNDVVLVKQGATSQGLMYWYNGTTWVKTQQKTAVNQSPLFDVVDENGISFSDTTVYDGSTFAGTKVFSYKVGSATADTNLGFSLSYKNIENVGDIVFNFNLMTDSFQYKEIVNVIYKKIKTGYLVTSDFAGNTLYVNGWQTCKSKDVQAAVRIYKNTNIVNNFDLDIFDDVDNLKDLTAKLYVNGIRLDNSAWSIVDAIGYKKIKLVNDISKTDVLTVKAYAAQPINSNGFYEIPVNLQSNPLNNDLAEFTLGEVIDHVNSIVENLPGFSGTFPGVSNIRNLGNITQYGTKFVQHSGPASLSLYHVTSTTNNIVRAIEHARDDYNQFKKNFVSVAETIGVDVTPSEQVNLILEIINKDKPSSFPYYFSDMVPYRASTTSNITVIDSRIKTYPLSSVFTLDNLSNKSVGVYLNNVQLLYKKDYVFSTEGFVVISATLTAGDTVTILEYESTDGSFVPETPTKLGMWPKYEPKIYLDTTLSTPRLMIQGHDGSQTLAYEDYRDDIILEFEKRIFNNIKVEYDPDIFDLTEIIPSFNRDTAYSLEEFNQILAPSFFKWASYINKDFTKSIGYDQYNSFTFNYSGYEAYDGRTLPGYWRGIYQWMLDTDRPNLCPWEMLGFTIEPSWWQGVYGPAPYTSNNDVMWNDIANGIIKDPSQPFTKLEKFAKPFLATHVPVDDVGNLISPSKAGLTKGIATSETQNDFVFGDIAPVESAWRRSSYYPFSIILSAMLMTPSKTFGVLLDRSKIVRNITGQLVYKETGLRIRPADVVLPSIYSSESRVQTAGIINYIANYILSDNLKSFTDYKYDLSNITAKLSYRVGAFTSKEKFNLLLDSKTPLSAGSVFIPPENYNTILNTSSPIKKITYSGVVITKLTGAYEVKGYSKTSPYFKYYGFQKSGISVNVGGISESFVQWQASQTYTVGKVVKHNEKYFRVITSHTSTAVFDSTKFSPLPSLPVVGGRNAIFRTKWDKSTINTIPYGAKFYSIQDVVDFLLGYGEYLKDEGFIFDEFNARLGAVTNWETSAKEFLFWTTQNWSAGQDKWKEWSSKDLIDFNSIVQYNGEYFRAVRNISPGTPFNEEDYVKLDGLSTVGSSVISLSPSADKITFTTELSVVDDIKNPFNGYELFKVDGQPLEAIFINSYREDNAVSYSPRTTDGIYGASFYLIQHEHVVILDNSTLFNDTIYNPESGYKQDRIKVAGYVSTDWYGGLDIPGFILDIANIQNWSAWTDYDLGDIVKYKQFYYTASKFLPGAELFDSAVWIRLDKKPTTQLLPNWSYKAAQFEDFYSLDSDNFDVGQQKMAQHLVGYQKRQYLENIIQDDVSEFKFYQGMIAEKGTVNVLNKLFDVLSAEGQESLDFYEEWAIRVGQYGASEAFENIEFTLDETQFRNNPQGFELTNTSEVTANFIIRQGPNDVYLKPLGYNNAPWPVLANYQKYLRSAGYVRASETFISLKSIDDIVNQDITTFKNGCYVSVSFKDVDWDVYRYSTTDIKVMSVSYTESSKTMTIETEQMPNLTAGSYIGLYGVDAINGFYKIISVKLNVVTLKASLQKFPAPFTKADSVRVYVLNTQRIDSIDDLDTVITDRLDPGELVWTDNQGDGRWATYEYNPVYQIDTITNTSPADVLNYGRYLATSANGSILAISNSHGEIETWDKAGYKSAWIQRQTIQRPYIEPNNVNLSKNFATVVAMSADGVWLATGSPSVSHVYTRLKGSHNPSTIYVQGDIVISNNVYYEALQTTSTGTPITSVTYWKVILYVPVDLTGTSLGLANQGIISLYKKDANNIYSLVDSIISPNPAANEKFGSALAFGSNFLYVTASGYNGVGRVYKLKYSTVTYTSSSYNSVGSSGKVLAITSTAGILPGMGIQGTGFTSNQYVTGIVNDTKIAISAAPDSTPSGTINFTITDWGYDRSEIYTGTVVDGNFGSTLTVSKDDSTLVISASGGTVNGKVVIIKNPGPEAVQTVITGTSPVFGQSVAVSAFADYIAISDSLASDEKLYQGQVNVYKQSYDTYVKYQTLTNHLPEESGYFGSKIAFTGNYDTLVVYSAYEDTTTYTTLDNDTTVFDNESTKFLTNKVDSGRVDVYDRYLTKWVYSETLEVPTVHGEGYGIGFAVGGDHIMVAAPYATDQSLVSGKVYDYLKPGSKFSWSVKHEETQKPDVSKIKKAFLYNKRTGELVKYLDVIDVAQGKIPGPAAEELRYDRFYDPAVYSVGTQDVNVDSNAPWTKEQVGRLWWDLRTAKFLNAYDSDVVYRTSIWNTLATGASIDVYEWVETNLLPDVWDKTADTEAGLAAGISGTSLYGNSVYSVRQRYDSISQSFKNTYYFWVKNKKTIPNIPGRYLSASAVASLIGNPRGEGYSYLSLTGLNSFSLANVKQYLQNTDVVLSVEYWTTEKTDQNVHSEWKIINTDSGTVIPSSIEIKWIDSLCGKDLIGRPLPDFSIPLKLRYGVENRPRQSMFVNRFEALKQLVEQANIELAKNQIVQSRDISQLLKYDLPPSTITGLYDYTENTEAELRFVNIGAFKRPTFDAPTIVDGRIAGINISYPGRGYLIAPYLEITGAGQGAVVRAKINAAGQITGAEILFAGEGYTSNTTVTVRDYSVLVYSDSQASGNWSVYSYDPTEQLWSRILSQTYDTRKYWSYVDWYDTGYNQFTAIDYVAETLADLSSLNVSIGQLVKVKNNDSASWSLLEKYSEVQSLDYTQTYKVVGLGNGTIKLNSSLYESIGTNTGYDSSTYDDTVFDNVPAVELRIILDALKNNIFINDLKTKYLDLFFTTMRYALSEQVYVDWIFKSSFVKARHNVGTLNQPATYKPDNLSNFQDYIAEVKPYRTKIREYVSSYSNLDSSSLLMSDFDLPPVLRNGSIVPVRATVTNGTLRTYSSAINEYPWKSWADNIGYSIIELKIINGGSGYISEPVVKFTSDSGSGAVARAFYTNGVINRIVLISPGSGYLSAPTVTLVGGVSTTGKPAKVVAIIGNGLVRTNLIGIKFDRTTQTNYIVNLEETETFALQNTTSGVQTRLQFALKWAPDIRINKSSVTVGGVMALRDSYKLSIVSSVKKGFTTYTGLITFVEPPQGVVSITYIKDISLLNAADRIKFYYNPADGELGNDLSQLMTGVDYGGVIVNGLGFEVSTGWGALPFFTDKWDSFDATFDDFIVTVGANASHSFTLPYLPAAGTELNVYYGQKNVDSHVSDGTTLQYSYNVYDNNPTFDVKRTVLTGAVATNYQPTGSAGTMLKVASTDLILPGMYIIGHGFNSNQKVVSVESSTSLTISSPPNILPTGTLEFTKNIAGSTILSLESTEGLTVGDVVASDAISAFGYDTYIKTILSDTEVQLNQIMYETISVGTAVVFSRTLKIPKDINIFTAGTITLSSPVAAGSVISIYGQLDPVRVDDPEFGTPGQTNPYAVMSTIIADGLTQTFTIPSELTINEGDQVIIRKSTSDGSLKVSDADYDTALSGGEFQGNYATGTFTSATGFSADDVIIDGDGFVTPTSSPAPEEVVPGQVVDTLAIKIFDQPKEGNANIKVENFIADGVKTDFSIANKLSSNTAVIVKIATGVGPDQDNTVSIKTSPDDYTVDYGNSTIVFNTAPDANSVVSIFSIGFAGKNILDIDYFVGDGYTTEFITKSKWFDTVTSLVYQDGVTATPDLFETDSTYDSANRIALRFGIAPPAGALINYIIVAGAEQTFSITKTERIATNGSYTYPLAYPVGTFLPAESNMIVRVDDEIIPGPINSYFEIKNNRLSYKIDSTKVLPYSSPISDIKVYVEDKQLSLGSDYTVEPGGPTIKINKIVYSLYAKKTLTVSVTSEQSYSYNESQGTITFAQAYDNTRVVEVMTSYRHDYLDVQRTETTVSSNLTVTPDTVEFYNYKGLTNGTLPLDRPVLNSSYVWVTHNNKLLTPSVDFILNEDKQSIQLAVQPSIEDKFGIVTFGANVVGPNIAYMQFKDMLNRVHYKRLSLAKRTRLVTDLMYNDKFIRVRDASAFDVPNPALQKPGIVEIRGERIEFYTIATEVYNENTPTEYTLYVLGKLRRGTLGTGTPRIHLAGTFVQEIGPSETIPYNDSYYVEQVISDGTNILPLNFIPTKTKANSDWSYATGFVSSIPSTYGQSDEIEVFVGGYDDGTTWQASTVYTAGNIVIIGSYTYQCTSTHRSGATFTSDVETVTVSETGTVTTIASGVKSSTVWQFFVGNIRLKKSPYKVHSSINAPYSPEGDVQLDAEFAVDGVSSHIRLTHALTLGTKVTVIKRTGTDWDGTTNVQVGENKVAKFLRASPGIWHEDINKYDNRVTTLDTDTIRFDSDSKTFDQGK